MAAETWTLPTHIEGWRRRPVQVAWAVSILVVAVVVALGFSRALVDPELVTLPPLTDLFARFGLDNRLMIGVALVVPFTTTLAIAWIVFWRRNDDPMALAFTAGMVLLYAYTTRGLVALGDIPVLRHALPAVFALGMILLAVVLAFFPDGRAVPRSARWLPLAIAALIATRPDAGRVLMQAIEGQSRDGRLFAIAWGGLLGLGLAAQAYRYRRVSGPRERQQAKWVMAPMAVAVVVTGLLLVGPLVLPAVADVAGWMLLAMVPIGVAIPLCIGNAVLRHRLYDIDHVVSRTVTYLVVILVLGGIYAGVVLTVGQTMSRLGGDGNQIATAVSVLVTVVAFRPVELRVRRTVDRRFNRSGYLARHAVEEYVDSLASEIEVEAIRAELGRVIGRAFQPSHLAIWTTDEPIQDQRSVVRSRVR
ncbi:MAG TPA: hypothetical protein VLB67_08290 [Acidimicrobiia bacterium]|nr:hypothetical protein [Acidimicrobiia bacterium]